jgi:hypothetical protein
VKKRIAALALVAAAIAVLATFLARSGDADPPEDRIVDGVPADARLYVHLDRDTRDWRRAAEALSRLPALSVYLPPVDLSEEPEAGVALLPGNDSPVAFSPELAERERNLGEVPVYRELVDGLPEDRFTYGFVGPSGMRQFRSIDSTLRAAAAATSIDGDTFRLRLRTQHSGEPGACSRGRGGDELLEAADPGAALYLEVPSIGCALRLAARYIDGAPAILGRFAELLPLLESRGALIAAPGESAPVITLIVDDVDEEQALDVLAGLQPTLIDLLGSQAPAFGATEVEGVTAATAQLAPGLQLSYAAWDGRLVVSTALDGIASVRRAEGLPGSERFESVLSGRPDSASALLFLDLDQLLALGEQAGLAEDPTYLAVRDDLQKLRAAGAVLSREEDFTTAELTFQIP